jgi:tetratricopeptide (TPR) repeat protein
MRAARREMQADPMRPLPALFTLALALAFTATARAQQDSFGQTISPEISQSVDRLRELRLPFDKTPDQVKIDAALAARELRAIVEREPNYFRGWFNLALALNEGGDYKGAKDAFDRAIAIRDAENIRDVSVLNTAGWAALRAGDYAAAEALLNRALADISKAEEGTAAAIHLNLGELYFLTQRLELSRKFYKVAREKYGSRQAADALVLIDRSLETIRMQQSLKP